MNTFQYLPKINVHASVPNPLPHFVKRLLPVLIACAVLSNAHGQSDKRIVQADQYFSAGEYLTAAGLYGQFLNPLINQKTSSAFPLNAKRNKGAKGYATNWDVRMKQAESYRLANYWPQALALYQDCFQKDSVKYAAALYWIGVCQRSMGNKVEAEESMDRFLKEHAAGSSYQSAAEKEKSIIEFIKSQSARPDSILFHVQKIETGTATDKSVYAPFSNTGDQFLLTSIQTDSVIKQGTNPNHNRLFSSTFAGGQFQNMQPILIEGMDASLNQGAASISPNGNYLYLTQWKKEKAQSVASIYYSKKSANGWGQPVLLTSVNQAGYNSKQPFCTSDGKYLFFASDRPGGFGNFDIWYAPLQTDGTTGEAINAGKLINTSVNEQAPYYQTSSGSLIFSSDREPGMGGYDLFLSKGAETNWKTPENMGSPVNSTRDDIYFFAAEKGNLLNGALIGSDRGAECCLATYAVSKSPKKKFITGVIRDCKDSQPLVNAEVILKETSGKTSRTTTGSDGKYMFELTGEPSGQQLALSKEKYNDKTSGLLIEGSNEKGWLEDTLYNAAQCMDKKLVIKVENVVSVYFDFDQSKLKERASLQLDSIYKVLKADSTATIQISGYTDGLGSVEYNKILSDKRAKACADYLIQKGISATRISFESFGACCPIEMELINGRDNPDGRALNRRALINISKTE